MMRLSVVLLVFFGLSGVLGQDEIKCNSTDCISCVSEFNCVWMVDGTCIEGCGSFPNIDCYYERIFKTSTADNPAEEIITVAEICEAWDYNITDNEACFEETTGEDCLKQAGCDWKMGIIENAEDRNWCALDLHYVPVPPPCVATTCTDCLEDPTCVWMKGDTCETSCDGRPNIDCYDPLTFGAGADAASEICQVYNESMVANEECFTQTTKDTCFGQSGCQWVGEAQGLGHCTLAIEKTDPEAVNDGSSGAWSSTSFSSVSFVVALFLWNLRY
ncbi:expressed unknown protein [Seminavis robusta]|uniref:Uncharacterized protein n=1 Tax=Seminavis robusta TaxID=568900 RepID=A0A9N8DDD6_9STRA|nr:expressed unknown protein [Seminavis robusta]|eukprot:Sro102_g052170.1 n/a (274) ;mRNA; r:89928-90749